MCAKLFDKNGEVFCDQNLKGKANEIAHAIQNVSSFKKTRKCFFKSFLLRLAAILWVLLLLLLKMMSLDSMVTSEMKASPEDKWQPGALFPVQRGW